MNPNKRVPLRIFMSIGIEFCHTIRAHMVKPISKSLCQETLIIYH